MLLCHPNPSPVSPLSVIPRQPSGRSVFSSVLVVFLESILVFPMMFNSPVEQWECGNGCGRNVWTDRGLRAWMNVALWPELTSLIFTSGESGKCFPWIHMFRIKGGKTSQIFFTQRCHPHVSSYRRHRLYTNNHFCLFFSLFKMFLHCTCY